MDEPPPHHHNNFDRADVVEKNLKKKNLTTTSKRGYNVRKSRTMSSTTSLNKYFFRWGIVI